MSEWIFLISHPSTCFCVNRGKALSMDRKSIRTAFVEVILSHGSEDQEKNKEEKERKATHRSIYIQNLT